MNHSHRPTVSVVIPTYNRAQYIGACLKSVLDQSFSDFEILVIDDGSTDNTREVVARFKDPRISYEWQANSGRPSVPRNRGIELSRGDYIAFLDSDDLWLPSKLEKQMAVAKRHPEAALIYCLARQFDETGDKDLVSPYRLKRSGSVYPFLLFYSFIPALTVLVQRRHLAQVGVFDTRPEFKAVEDYELWLRMAARYPVRFVPEVLAKYRIHGSNISADKFAEFDKLEALYKKVMAENPVSPLIYKKVMAKVELRRFRHSLKTGKSLSESLTFLWKALQTDYSNLTAMLLLALARLGVLDRLRKRFM